MGAHKMVTLFACFIFVVSCAPVEYDLSSSAELTSAGLPAGASIDMRDIRETGMVLPMSEAVKWSGGSSGLLYAELSGDTYTSCSDLHHPGHDMNVLWTSGNADLGTRVYAIADGEVVDIVRISGEWASITIRHTYRGAAIYSNYGHMSVVEVSLGQYVRMGDMIGQVGRAGTLFAHLHFEIRTDSHTCHQTHVSDADCYRDYHRDVAGRETYRPGMYFTCSSLRMRDRVLSWYSNPLESVTATSMDVYADDTVGLSLLGDAILPAAPAFPRATDRSANPSTETRPDLFWLRGRPSTSSSDITNALVREYRPGVWSGRSGYLVYPVNHGARHPFWVRSAIGERWYDLMTEPFADPRRCGLPVTGEYLVCPDSVRPCRTVRQDFQFCHMTWQEGRHPELEIVSYSGASPGAFSNRWAARTSRGASIFDPTGYSYDDPGFIIADAYERNGAARRMGEPYGFAHQLGDTRYLAQSFSGGEYGRTLVVFDPENAIVSSSFVYLPSEATEALAYGLRMTPYANAEGYTQGVVYGNGVEAVVIRTGFLDWYDRHEGARRLGAPLNDEYQWHTSVLGRTESVARQDFESGNCLVWVWDRPGVGRTYCGTIRGTRCADFLSYVDSCPFVGISIDGGSRGPVPLDLPPSGGSGSESGGGVDPPPDDASIPAPPPDAGVSPTPGCSVDTDCPAYGSGWRCRSGTCRETDIDGDGYLGSDGDCNIDVARIHRDAVESCDYVDEDCDGRVDETFDLTSDPRNCGVCGRICPGGETCTSGACVRPCSASPEVCGDGLDNNRDGRVDEGCAPVCTPIAEVCDGRDQDCDGVADDGLAPLACYDGPSGTSGRGICRGGTRTCSGGSWGSCVGQVLPRTESCNNQDDDCDGRIDEGITPIVCSTLCGPGTRACVGGSFGTCSARVPSAETCNGLDDDCDGTVDEGVCAPACVPTSPSRDICDGRDNDCDGTVDNGCPAMSPYLVEIWMDPSVLDDCPDPGGFRINLWGSGGIVLQNAVGEPFRRTIDASWVAASAVSLSCSVAPMWHDWTGHVGEPSSLNGVLVMRLGGRDMLPTSLVCDDIVNPAWGAKPYLPLESRYEGSCTPRW